MDVPFNREELRDRLRLGNGRNADTTQRNFRPAQRTGFVRSIENFITLLERTIVAISNLAILFYQLIKYACIGLVILFSTVLAYYGFKYVLLFIIWLQNHL